MFSIFLPINPFKYSFSRRTKRCNIAVTEISAAVVSLICNREITRGIHPDPNALQCVRRYHNRSIKLRTQNTEGIEERHDLAQYQTQHSARVISAGILVSANKLFKLEPGEKLTL